MSDLSWSGKTGPQKIVGELNKESYRVLMGLECLETRSNPGGRGEAEDCRPLKAAGKGIYTAVLGIRLMRHLTCLIVGERKLLLLSMVPTMRLA